MELRTITLTTLFAGAALTLSIFTAAPAAAQQTCSPGNVTADVVAMDQVITYNRMAAFNPAGMIFALERDVFPKGTPAADQTLANSCAGGGSCMPGQVQLRDDKRPRPLTLRVNAGCNITINLENLLAGADITDAKNEALGIRLCENPVDGVARPEICQSEQPATRNVGIHINGMQWVNGPSDDGSNVGGNGSSLAGGPQSYTLHAAKEGAYVISSGPNLGGEGGSGAIASGLFGVLNVEPAGSEWYRSQLTREEMLAATTGYTADGQPLLNYDAVYPTGHPYAGKPILNILAGGEIFHNDLNAIITGSGRGGFIGELPNDVYPNRGQPFREFTVAFHDEVKIVQAFPGWFDALPFTLGSVKDGFAINYGTGGIGAEIIGNRLGVGPMHECVECKYEEFFLTAWAVGDPAMIVDIPANAGLEALAPGVAPPEGTQGPKATRAFYPDDPSNVWHGYLNDRTKIRNIHVGTEHHIFHLHAHQWHFAADDPGSNYLDAQALGPGSSFTYEIAFGGGGNRAKTAGDSIFHCHFYPHFAQGMWGLWRVHDTFEIGSYLDPLTGLVAERGLPDSEICADPARTMCGGYNDLGQPIAGGTPTPGVVPLPTRAMAPMPGSFWADTDGVDGVDTPFMGYPFYIPGVAGHRPPSPPLDLVADGGIPRHVITAGTAHAVQTPTDFDKVLLTATGFEVPETGTPAEKAAMAFHGCGDLTPVGGPDDTTVCSGGPLIASFTPENVAGGFQVNGLPPNQGAPYAEPCRADVWVNGVSNPWTTDVIGNERTYAASVIELDVDLNKVGWHFGQQRIIVLDQDVAATMAGTRAPEPFVMRANTNDCVDFDHTNLVPNVYQLDDFQVKTPTDVIGQHIHLVKFDVTSADGAANGWNYEDGTLSPDESIERIAALTAPPGADPDHPLAAGDWTGDPLGPGGLRTTRQRWFIDPGWEGNVFTHDHYGPSTHQQAGLYGTLLVEPEGASFSDPVTGAAINPRQGGWPTSWRADIDCAGCDGSRSGDAWREFYLEFADFQLAYRGAAGDGAGFLNGPGQPVNPSDRNEVGLPDILRPNCDNLDAGPNGCRPEAISAADPGTFVVNYRNEPLALRLRDPLTNNQAAGQAGDLSYAFQSRTDRADTRLNDPEAFWPYSGSTASQGALAGDPFTPLLRVYEDDKVNLRVQVGAHEEGHNFSINGVRWLQQWASPYSGFRNSQMAGISEYFLFRTPGLNAVTVGPFEDYMYQAGSSVDARWNGSWGIMRAYDGLIPDLQPLPTNPDGKAPPLGGSGGPPPFRGPCPRNAPERKFDLIAVRAADVLPGLPGGKLEYYPGGLNDPTAMLYLKKADLDRQGMLKSERRVEPLILRAAAGECIFITLTNQLGAAPLDLEGFNLLPMIVNDFNNNQIAPSSEVGLHAQLVEYDMSFSDGMNVGFNPVQTAPIGGKTTYKWYAGKIDTVEGQGIPGNRKATPVEYGAINLMASDPIEGSSKGLIGALIIEPEGSTWADGSGRGNNRTDDGELDENDQLTRAALTVSCPSGPCGSLETGESFRDFVVLFQDDVNMRFADGSPVPTVSEEEEPEDSGMKAINYRTDPIWQRLAIGPTADAEVTRQVDFTNAFVGDPVTPIFTASSGQEIRFRVLKPGGHNRNQVFTVHGHLWARHPFGGLVDNDMDGVAETPTVIDPDNPFTFWHGEQMGHGPTNHVNAVPLGGAGLQGDYLYRDVVPVHVYNGAWGLLRVE